MSSNLLWFSSPYLSLFLSHFVPPPFSCFGVFSGISMSLYVPRWTSLFLFYIMAFLPLDGKKKISFSVSYSFLIWVLWARFQARNVWIQRSLFLGKLYKIESSFQRHEYCNFGSLRLEIWAITRDNIWSAGSSSLIQSLFFDSLFGLRNSKNEFYALHMFCRPSSQIFENGDECLELSCITFFVA